MAGMLFVPAKVISVSSAECMSSLLSASKMVGNWQGSMSS